MFDDTGSKLEVYVHVKFFEAGVRKTTYSVQISYEPSIAPCPQETKSSNISNVIVIKVLQRDK